MKDLDAIRAGIVLVITLLGSGGALGLWRLLTRDFLDPYRADQRDLRERLAAAEARADAAVEASRKCEEREAHLRRALVAAGIDVGPIS